MLMGMCPNYRKMKMLKTTLSIIMFALFVQSCASVGAVIDGGKMLTTGVVDASVKTVGGVSQAVLQDASDITKTASDAVGGVVDTVVEEVDRQTDELQNPKKEEGK